MMEKKILMTLSWMLIRGALHPLLEPQNTAPALRALYTTIRASETSSHRYYQRKKQTRKRRRKTTYDYADTASSRSMGSTALLQKPLSDMPLLAARSLQHAHPDGLMGTSITVLCAGLSGLYSGIQYKKCSALCSLREIAEQERLAHTPKYQYQKLVALWNGTPRK